MTTQTFNLTCFYQTYNCFYPNKPQICSNWLIWFIGFCEGDGSLLISGSNLSLGKHKLALSVAQHKADYQLMQIIKTTFGFGRVEQETNRAMCRYIVCDIKNIALLITLFNGNCVLPKFYKRLNLFNQKYNQRVANVNATKQTRNLPTIELLPYTLLPSLQDAWLSGFTDAEGCFFARYQPKSLKTRSGWLINYSIGQKGAFNYAVLKQINKLWPGGRVVKCDPKSDFWLFRNGMLNQNLALICYFDNFKLRSKKKIDFKKWAFICNAVYKKQHLQPETNQKLIALSLTINQAQFIN